jgi:hypothetical protein
MPPAAPVAGDHSRASLDQRLPGTTEVRVSRMMVSWWSDIESACQREDLGAAWLPTPLRGITGPCGCVEFRFVCRLSIYVQDENGKIMNILVKVAGSPSCDVHDDQDTYRMRRPGCP